MERLTTSLYSLGAKLFVVVCKFRLREQYLKRRVSHFTTYLYLLESRWFDKPGLNRGKYSSTLHLNFPLGVTNEGRELSSLLASIKFLAPLPGTPVYKIGKLHTIF